MSTKLGEIAEQKFKLMCLELDIPIYSPAIDNTGADFIIKNNNKHYSIQVKSSFKSEANRPTYKINTFCGVDGKPYPENAFDYLVVYLHDISTWFIIPKKEFKSKNIRLNPGRRENRFNKYKEAWHIITR